MPADMKNIIGEAFVKMVARKGIDKITVKSLIEECHISRQTFYYHFQDIMDVLEWCVRQETNTLVKESLKAEDLQTALQIFISFNTEHFSWFQKLMDSHRRAQIETLLVDAVKTYMIEMSRHSHSDLYVNYEDMDVLLQFNACGLVGVLLEYGKTQQNISKGSRKTVPAVRTDHFRTASSSESGFKTLTHPAVKLDIVLIQNSKPVDIS